MIEKQIDRIEVTGVGTVEVRVVTRTVENGRTISETYHRHVVCPGDDYSAEDAKVRDVCAAAHTPAVIAAYRALTASPPVDWFAVKAAEVKREAQRRIFAKYPQWKQTNMSARFDELRATEDGKYRDAAGVLQPARALTAAEISEIASFSAAWSWVKSVRAASNAIEADILASATPDSFDVAGDARWPA